MSLWRSISQMITENDIESIRKQYIVVLVADCVKEYNIVSAATYNLAIEAANWSWQTSGKKIFLDSFS